jgi:hypothetical protein
MRVGPWLRPPALFGRQEALVNSEGQVIDSLSLKLILVITLLWAEGKFGP